MEESMELPEDNPLVCNNNNTPLLMTSIISPKNNRRLAQSCNTTSQESLTFSNSTYHNKLTERSPPLFNLEYIHGTNLSNDQNVNTMNYCFNLNNNNQNDHKSEWASTFGAKKSQKSKGMAIKFDRITEESGIESEGNSFFNINNRSMSGIMENGNNVSELMKEQLIELPCFLSLENSPENMKMAASLIQNVDEKNEFNKMNNSKEELEDLEIMDVREVLEKDSLTIPMKMATNYKKINPLSNHIMKKEESLETDITTRREFLKDENQKLNKRELKSTKSRKGSQNVEDNKRMKSPDVKREEKLKKESLNKKHQNRSSASKSPSRNSINFSNSKINYNDSSITEKDRIRELEYELRTAEIEREELRTRVGILNELLEEKFLENNSMTFTLFTYNENNNKHNDDKKEKSYVQENKLKLHKNIDLVLELRTIKEENEKLIKENAMIKQELQGIINDNQSDELEIISKKYKGKSFIEKAVQVNKTHNIDKLHQESSQILLNFSSEEQKHIEELKEQVNQYKVHQKETERHILLLEEKEKRFEQQERPKLLQCIKELNEKINEQKDFIEKLEMENNLLTYMKLEGGNKIIISPDKKSEMSLPSIIKQSPESITNKMKSNLVQSQTEFSQQLKEKDLNKNKQQLKQQKEQNLDSLNNSSYEIVENEQNTEQFIKKEHIVIALTKEYELITLKKERDYFKTQYESMKSLQSHNYQLELKIEDLENELNSIKQLIEVDDEITF